jgi:hypothetical protein
MSYSARRPYARGGAKLYGRPTGADGPIPVAVGPLPEETRPPIRGDAVAALAGVFPVGPAALHGGAVTAGATRPR